MILATYRDYGIGWDGRVQSIYGRKMLDYYLSVFRDQSVFWYSDLRFYGGFFDLIAAAADRFSPFGEYETRHLLGGALLLIGLFGAWRLTRLLAGARAALIALVLLVSTPLLFGHAFINPKDSPFAWLLVWVLYFSCQVIARGGSLVTYVGLAITLGLALGTKVMAVGYIVYLVAILVFGAAIAWWCGKRGQAWVRTRTLTPVLLMVAPWAFLIMTFFWPWAVQRPDAFVGSIAEFLRFPHRVPVLWDGETMTSTQPPALYLPMMLLLQLPEIVLAGLLLALTFAALHMRGQTLSVFSRVRTLQFLLIAAAAFAPVAAFMVLRPTVYNGMRQYLFIVPPLVILAAVGFDIALTHAARWRAEAVIGLALILGLAASRETLLMASIHPYEYIAFNSLDGDLANVGRKFELDYWGTSLGEAGQALTRILAKGHFATVPKVYVCGDNISADYFMPDTVEFTDKIDTADFVMAPLVAVCQNVLRRPARTVVEIKRDGAILSRVLDVRPSQAAASLR